MVICLLMYTLLPHYVCMSVYVNVELIDQIVLFVAGDLGTQVLQPLVPSTSNAASVVANNRHMCGICQLVCWHHIVICIFIQ